METLQPLLESSMRLMVPLLLAALGELISERSGVTNIGLEGMITAGAFGSYLGYLALGESFTAVLIGAAAGIAVAMIMAAASVWFGGNQMLVGFGIFLLVPSLANFLFFQSGISGRFPTSPEISIPLLSDIPFLGPILFQQNAFFYTAVVIAILIGVYFGRTRAGLIHTAVGHDPHAMSARRVSSKRVQTYALAACGVLAGLAGASLVLGTTGAYSANVVDGRGLIALALVILGRWTLSGVVAGAFAIGLLNALELTLSRFGAVPLELLGALPWIGVLVMLVITVRFRSAKPRSL